jgi:hypothetical protein
MKAYLISYDLDKPGQNYERVIARLKEHGAARVLMSQWALKTTWSATQLRDDLQSNGIDANDRLLVVELRGEWAFYNVLSSQQFKQDALNLRAFGLLIWHTLLCFRIMASYFTITGFLNNIRW